MVLSSSKKSQSWHKSSPIKHQNRPKSKGQPHISILQAVKHPLDGSLVAVYPNKKQAVFAFAVMALGLSLAVGFLVPWICTTELWVKTFAQLVMTHDLNIAKLTVTISFHVRILLTPQAFFWIRPLVHQPIQPFQAMKQQQFEAPVRSFQVKNTFIDAWHFVLC